MSLEAKNIGYFS